VGEEQNGVTTVDREALYKEVWATPGRALARKYGISVDIQGERLRDEATAASVLPQVTDGVL